jgi:hypothetical protein
MARSEYFPFSKTAKGLAPVRAPDTVGGLDVQAAHSYGSAATQAENPTNAWNMRTHNKPHSNQV